MSDSTPIRRDAQPSSQLKTSNDGAQSNESWTAVRCKILYCEIDDVGIFPDGQIVTRETPFDSRVHSISRGDPKDNASAANAENPPVFVFAIYRIAFGCAQFREHVWNPLARLLSIRPPFFHGVSLSVTSNDEKTAGSFRVHDGLRA